MQNDVHNEFLIYDFRVHIQKTGGGKKESVT